MNYKFENYVLDMDRFELRCAGAVVHLRPKAFELLAYLVAERHRAVSRDELIRHVWRGQVVGDAAISSVIKETRRAVGDDGAQQRIIRTVHSRGFRCVADVEVEARSGSVPPQTSSIRPPSAAPAAQELSASSFPPGAIIPSGAVPNTQSEQRVPLVGRERDLAALRSAWDKVRHGRSQVVGLVGHAGVGKSRIISEFIEEAQRSGHQALLCHCDEDAAETPYYPICQLIRRACGATEDEADSSVYEKLVSCLVGIPGEALKHAPSLLLDIARTAPDSKTAFQPPAASPATTKRRMFDALRILLTALAQPKAIVIVVEDLHWVDATSEDWLDFLTTTLSATSVMFLCSYRPGYRPPWIDKSYATQQTLHPLTQDASRRLLRHMLWGRDVSEDQLSWIADKAEGNAFFLRELVQSLEDTQRHNELAQLNITTLPLPHKIRAVLSMRIDRLPERSKHLIQVAAVVGREVPLPLLSSASGLAEDDLNDVVEDLVAAEFLEHASIAPVASVTFCHALTQQAAYESLAPVAKNRLHEQIAAALSASSQNLIEWRPELLATHYTAAAKPEAAIACWLAAGRKAASRFAAREAVEHFRNGLALIDDLAPSPMRDQYEVKLCLALATMVATMKSHAAPEVERAYNRAYALCKNLENECELYSTVSGLSQYYLMKGEYRQIEELQQFILQRLSNTSNDRAHLGDAHRLLGLAQTLRGQLKSALQHLELGHAMSETGLDNQDAQISTDDRRVMSLTYLANTLWLLGHPEMAFAHAERALEIAHAIGHPFILTMAHHMFSTLLVMARFVERAEHEAQQAIDLADEHDFAYYRWSARIVRGWALAHRGQGGAGVVELRTGLDALIATGAGAPLSIFAAMLADAYLQAGRTNEGLLEVERALNFAERHEEYVYLPEIYRLHGELNLRSGNLRDPEQWFKLAYDKAAEMGAKSWQLRIALSRARLSRLHGQSHQAQELLSNVLHSFSEGAMGPDFSDSQSFFAEL